MDNTQICGNAFSIDDFHEVASHYLLCWDVDHGSVSDDSATGRQHVSEFLHYFLRFSSLEVSDDARDQDDSNQCERKKEVCLVSLRLYNVNASGEECTYPEKNGEPVCYFLQEKNDRVYLLRFR